MENISKYLEDKQFIAWVFHPDETLEKWWKTFETSNPKERINILLARKILLKLHTKDKELSEEEKILIFSKVIKEIEEKQKSQKSIWILSSFLKYAAVAILFFSFGALFFYEQNNISTQFYSQNLAEPVADNEAKLIRPNGKNIILEEKKSVIEYTKSGKIKVNNTTLEPSQPIQKGTPELNQLIIPHGKTSEIVLSDGTKVYLNAGSRFVYPEFFNDKNREVFLAGEAFFEVAHDKNHPFIVQTTDIRINVLGTQFNVSAYCSENIIETVLVKGKVTLEQNNSGLFSKNIDLEIHQLAAFNRITKKTELKTVDTDNYTLWKDGIFKFRSTHLNRIVKKLERFYNIRFQYNNPLQGTIQISGKLDLNEDREEIISRLATTASVKIVKIKENYYEIN